MVNCRQQGCLTKAISLCWCSSISCMCEYHLKDHLKSNINSKHNFKFFHNDIYNKFTQTIENSIKLIIDGLERYKEYLISAQSCTNNAVSTAISQSIEIINCAQESYKNIYRTPQGNSIEIDAIIEIILSNSTLFDPIALFIKHLIISSFEPELAYQNFIFEILSIENRIKKLFASWSYSPLIPFKISFAHPDDSKSHWHKANILKADIEKINENYLKALSNLSSSAYVKGNNDISLIFLKNIYKDFLSIKKLFSQTIAQKEISLGRLEKILNLYWKENRNILAIISFDTKTKEIIVDSIKIEKTKDLCSTGISLSIIALPNSEVFCYAPSQRYKSFIMNSSYCKRYIPESHRGLFEGLVYFKEDIFIFGGYEKLSASRSAKKYNLNKNKWDILVQLPKPISSCSCVVYKEKILLSGQSNKSLYEYDIKINSYSLILKGLSEWSKVLFSYDSKIYIIEGLGGVYESERENEYNFVLIKKDVSPCNGDGQNFWVNRGDLVYYSMWNENKGINYYCFNLETKKIVSIKNLAWSTYFL